MTPESSLAAASMLSNAGGGGLDALGNPLGDYAGIRQTTTIVAAATEGLARGIVDALASNNT